MPVLQMSALPLLSGLHANFADRLSQALDWICCQKPTWRATDIRSISQYHESMLHSSSARVCSDVAGGHWTASMLQEMLPVLSSGASQQA